LEEEEAELDSREDEEWSPFDPRNTEDVRNEDEEPGFEFYERSKRSLLRMDGDVGLTDDVGQTFDLEYLDSDENDSNSEATIDFNDEDSDANFDDVDAEYA